MTTSPPRREGWNIRGSQLVLKAISIMARAFRFVAYLGRRAIFPLFERLLPADDRLWCFCTWDRYYHTLDNPRAVLEHVLRHHSIVCVVLQKATSPEGVDTPNLRFVKAESIRGAYYVARSRVLLLGYALRGMASYANGVTDKHIVAQLLHGVTQRRVGLLFPRETWWAKETPKYSAMFASSERERQLLMSAFSPIPSDRIWITGLPRNDILLNDEATLPSDYRAQLSALRAQLQGRRLVLYAPTWRDQEHGHYRFSSDEAERLSEVLRRHRAVLGIHGHPNVRHKGWYRVENPPEEILHIGHYPDVTLVLRDTSVLLTDYSSIFLDFLLTNRPIIHFAYDYDAFLESRIGRLYEPEEYFAGPVPRTFDELLQHLDHALTGGLADATQYDKVRQVFHQHGGESGKAVSQVLQDLVRVPT